MVPLGGDSLPPWIALTQLVNRVLTLIVSSSRPIWIMEAIIFLQGADLDWELTRRDLSNLSTAQPCRLSGRVVAGGGSIEVISH